MAGRRAKRLRATAPVTVGFRSPAANFKGELVDLSKTGLLVRCTPVLKPGAIGRIAMAMGGETIEMMVAVRREVATVGLAFEFLQMSQHDRELLQRLIARFH